MQKDSLQKDKWLGIGVLCLGILFGLAIPFQVAATSESGNPLVSGRTLPVIISALLVLLGALLAFKSHCACKECAPEDFSNVPAMEMKARTKRVLTYLGAICVYMLCVSIIGFEISSGLMLIFAMWYTGCTSKLTIGVTAVLTPILIYLIFCKGMYMAMPDSLLVDYIRTM